MVPRSVKVFLNFVTSLQKTSFSSASQLKRIDLSQCQGCGVKFQTDWVDKPGFIQRENLEKWRNPEILPKQAPVVAIKPSVIVTEDSSAQPTKRLPSVIAAESVEQMLEWQTSVPTLADVRKGNQKQQPLRCARCHQLSHHGYSFGVVETTDAHTLQHILAPILAKKSRHNAFIYLLDLFDLNGSLMSDLTRMLRGHRILFVGNKFDLFDVEPSKRHLFVGRLKQELERCGYREHSVHLISAQTGFGVSALMEEIESFPPGTDMYVVGATNAGKSTLINRLSHKGFISASRGRLEKRMLTELGGSVDGDKQQQQQQQQPQQPQQQDKIEEDQIEEDIKRAQLARAEEEENKRERKVRERDERDVSKADEESVQNRWKEKDRKSEEEQALLQQTMLTTSPVPGTTLGFIRFAANKTPSIHIIDTPGMVNPKSLLGQLNYLELRAVVPTTTAGITPLTYRLPPNHTLLLGWLCRVDVLSDSPVFLTVFRSPTVHVHVRATDRLAKLASRHPALMRKPLKSSILSEEKMPTEAEAEPGVTNDPTTSTTTTTTTTTTATTTTAADGEKNGNSNPPSRPLTGRERNKKRIAKDLEKAKAVAAMVAAGLPLPPPPLKRMAPVEKDEDWEVLAPPYYPDRLKTVGLGDVQEGNPRGKVFTIEGQGWLRAAADIVFPGIGWVAVTGTGDIQVRVSMGGNATPTVRPPLMLFEARSSAKSWKNQREPTPPRLPTEKPNNNNTQNDNDNDDDDVDGGPSDVEQQSVQGVVSRD